MDIIPTQRILPIHTIIIYHLDLTDNSKQYSWIIKDRYTYNVTNKHLVYTEVHTNMIKLQDTFFKIVIGHQRILKK